MDLRINRKARKIPVIARTTKMRSAAVSALNPYSRTAYRTSSAEKTRGSVIHRGADMEHFQDRLRPGVGQDGIPRGVGNPAAPAQTQTPGRVTSPGTLFQTA